MVNTVREPGSRKPQKQQPGLEWKMLDKPVFIRESYRGSGKLEGKIALITGGDSGIGRAAAVHFAREGADISIVYLNEKQDAEDTKGFIEQEGRDCLLIEGDVGDMDFCKQAISQTFKQFGALDILVNNAAEQHPTESIEDITPEQLRQTFRTNIEGYFFMAIAALKYLKQGGTIINTTSVTAYRGSPHLTDYSATKGAIAAFTRSLSGSLIKRGIRVNGVAPGPIWTPLIPASFSEEELKDFGRSTPMERPGQPCELGPCYVFLACEVDSSYMTGQIIHINGGSFVNT